MHVEIYNVVACMWKQCAIYGIVWWLSLLMMVVIEYLCASWEMYWKWYCTELAVGYLRTSMCVCTYLLPDIEYLCVWLGMCWAEMAVWHVYWNEMYWYTIIDFEFVEYEMSVVLGNASIVVYFVVQCEFVHCWWVWISMFCSVMYVVYFLQIWIEL